MTNEHTNDLLDIPAAACRVCGGWTSQGGMSQHRDATTPVLGRTGCTGPHMDTRPFREQLFRQQVRTLKRSTLDQLI